VAFSSLRPSERAPKPSRSTLWLLAASDVFPLVRFSGVDSVCRPSRYFLLGDIGASEIAGWLLLADLGLSHFLSGRVFTFPYSFYCRVLEYGERRAFDSGKSRAFFKMSVRFRPVGNCLPVKYPIITILPPRPFRAAFIPFLYLTLKSLFCAFPCAVSGQILEQRPASCLSGPIRFFSTLTFAVSRFQWCDDLSM